MRKGPLMIIGGAEDRLRTRTMLEEFVVVAGGTSDAPGADPDYVPAVTEA